MSAIFGFFLRTKFGANYVSTSGVTIIYKGNVFGIFDIFFLFYTGA